MFVFTWYNPTCGLEDSSDISSTAKFKLELRKIDYLRMTAKINTLPLIIHSLILLESLLT